VTREFQNDYSGSGLEEFLEQVSLITDIDTYDEKDESVTLMTLHNAKGLEFPVVFIVGMEEGIFPHSRSMTTAAELEEERRLCYVGLTRAKKRIYVTNAWSRNLWGGTNYNMESRFLKEIPDELFAQATGGEAQTTPPAQIDFDFAVGDEVIHKKFGRGKVTSIDSPGKVTVLFPGEGQKTLLLDYAPLEKP
jgi:DNA helicase-2/ATP-dependent DNA helicase PcrA